MEVDPIEAVVYLAGNLFSIYITSLFFHVFFDIETTGKRKIFRCFSYFLYFIFSSFGVMLLNINPATNLLVAVLGIAIVSITYNGNWKYRIFAVIIIFATQVVCEDLSYYLLKKLNTIHIFIIGTIISQLLTFIVVLLIKKSVDLKKGEAIRFSEWLSIIAIPVCSFIISVWVLDDCKSKMMASIGGIGVLLIDISTFYIIDHMHKMHRNQLDYFVLEQQTRAYMQQISTYKDSEESLSSLRHDIKNHLFAIDQLAKKNDCEKIRKYLGNLILISDSENRIVSTGNYLIDGFLNMKLKEMLDCGAETNTELQIPKNLEIDGKDISIILGNLLDNAIYALKSDLKDNGKKFFEIIMKADTDKLFIKISNSYNGDIKKTGDTFITTKVKKKGHGIGLKNVKKIVEAYHGHMEIVHDDSLFSVAIIIFLK